MVQTTVVFLNGATQMINHSDEIFQEVKKNKNAKALTLREKLAGLVLDLGLVHSWKTVGGEQALTLIDEKLPVPKEHGMPKEVKAIEGMDKRQLRRLHKNDKFTMFFNVVCNASHKQAAA